MGDAAYIIGVIGLFHSLRAVRCGARQDLNMDIIVGCIGVVLIVYLFVSVIRPERF